MTNFVDVIAYQVAGTELSPPTAERRAAFGVDLACRAAAGDFAPDVRLWLQRGLADHLAGADLHQSLGLDPASRVRARNAALREAAALLSENGTAGPWAVAGRLAQAIRRYERRIAPMVALDPARARTLGPLDAALRRAFLAGNRMVRTRRKLFDLV